MTLLGALVGLVVYSDAASALSSPSSGYHFGVGAGAVARRKVTASDLRKKQPRSYVPDGLTEEQYLRIKADELAKREGIDLGAWGPRFARVDGDPEGNWFNLPSLWTRGFEANGSNAVDDNVGSEERGIVNLLAMCLRRYGLAYLMLLLSTQLLARSLSPKNVFSSKWLTVRMLLPLVVLKPVGTLADFAWRRKRVEWLSRRGATKLAGAVSMLLAATAFVLR